MTKGIPCPVNPLFWPPHEYHISTGPSSRIFFEENFVAVLRENVPVSGRVDYMHPTTTQVRPFTHFSKSRRDCLIGHFAIAAGANQKRSLLTDGKVHGHIGKITASMKGNYHIHGLLDITAKWWASRNK
mmetsp:Transcript_30587/g.60892  ORF Transcript_30587/g.60892 Transcript_30587/m.60892 type:complete len:129 (-) Transcript_30587:286-672(-)